MNVDKAGHIPVLLAETISALSIRPGGIYVDGTLGRAGHTREILRGGAARVIGIDRDDAAIAAVTEKHLAGLTIVKGRHGAIASIAKGLGLVGMIDGVLLDLGVSSPQLDEASRGFSFRLSGPLDMRMDRSGGETAAALVARESAEGLATLFRTLGEEPQARRIADAIVRARDQKPFVTTLDLADFIERLVGRHGPHHPATRVFQALRMAVNDEMGELESALHGALEVLKPGGRLVVITFESLTDRVTKRFMVEHVGRDVSLQAGGSRWEGILPRVRFVMRKPVVAQDQECKANVRARSAKLRCIERLAA